MKNLLIVIVFVLCGDYFQSTQSDQIDRFEIQPKGPICRRLKGLCVRRRKACQPGYEAPPGLIGRPACYKRRKCCRPIPPSTTTSTTTTTIITTGPPTTTTTAAAATTTIPPTGPPTTTTTAAVTTKIPPTGPPTTTTTAAAATTTIPPTGPPTTTTTAAAATTKIPPTVCPDGFVPIEQQCFKFYNDSFLQYGAAKVQCEHAGTRLAEPKTTDTFIKLAEYAIEHHTSDWDRHPEFAHFWLGGRGDGSGFLYDSSNQYIHNVIIGDVPWMGPDQPEGRSNEWCLDLRAESDPITEPLAVWKCQRTHYYICEHVLE